MATRGFAACVSLLSHHRSVDAANPWSAANDTALAPLARHNRTRSVHFAAVSASLMTQTMRPNRTPRKDGARTGHTYYVTTLVEGRIVYGADIAARKVRYGDEYDAAVKSAPGTRERSDITSS